MPFRTLYPNNQDSVFAYLDDVLTYYKTAENASLGEWPTLQIGWNDFPKTQVFYNHVITWFANRNIRVIIHNTKRYLSTFILAAEFPPTLGYGKLVEDLVRQCGWLSLYRSPESNLIEYIQSIDPNAYTVAQRQSLRLNSEGFYALLDLIQILSSIRYSLDSYESITAICTAVSEKKGCDLDLVFRIAHAYNDILIPPQKSAEQKPIPKFSYQLIQTGLDWSLVIKHNLNKKVSLPIPSSLVLPRFTSGMLSILSERENVLIEEIDQLVKLEVQEGFLEIECSFQSDYIPVLIRNKGLQKLQFIITVKDTDARPHQLFLGQVKRTDDFLIFERTGTEIVSNTHLFKRGETLRLVPLIDSVGIALRKSAEFFQEEQTGNLPVFQTINTQLSSIQVGKTVLQFRTIPFTITLREQTAWEAAFNKSRKVIPYFYSPLMEMYLEGEFTEEATPKIRLYKRIRDTNGEEQHSVIQVHYHQGQITPVQPLPSPGQYTLEVAFGDDNPSSITFNLLPIRSIKIIKDKHIQLKMYAPVINFNLLGTHTCRVSFTKNHDIVDINFDSYGIHEIEASFQYQNSQHQKIDSPIKFKFEAAEEVLGHFSKVVTVGNTEPLSLENDLIANSYLEFQRTSLRNAAKPYKVSAYMEYSQASLRIFPECMVMYPEGSRMYPLTSLVTHVRDHKYSRLLIIVEYEGSELFRAEFLSNRRPILNLEKEWNQGAYSGLKALPLDTLQPEDHQSLEKLPANCLVYGMIENASGNYTIASFPSYTNAASLPSTGLASTFLAQCNQYMKPDENSENLLKQILQTPEQSSELLEWLSKAYTWDYSYDIKIFAKLIDTFPVVVAWAEMARNPGNRDLKFALSSPRAQKLYRAGMLYLPELAKVISHPRFSPELITIKDLETLEQLNLLPIEGSLMKLFLFCCTPFITNGKPVLSWLAMFWLRRYCEKQDKTVNFRACLSEATVLQVPLVTHLSKEFTQYLPTYEQDREYEQDFEKLISYEQTHYENPPLVKITGLKPFLDVVKKPFFSEGLQQIIKKEPLFYAEPDLRGFQTSTKWKCIIFLSLTAVCRQLGKNSIEDELQKLWALHHKTYIYLLKWLNNHEETARIYNAYYEYWMTRFWEEENV